jgi:hypothetical protein
MSVKLGGARSTSVMDVDIKRIGLGEWLAAASGALLLLFMFLDWYAAKATARVSLPGGIQSATRSHTACCADAWEAFSVIDIVLLLCVLVAVGAIVLRAAGAYPAGASFSSNALLLCTAALATVLILFRIVFLPDLNAPAIAVPGVDVTVAAIRESGLWLGFIAALGMLVGAVYASLERLAEP